MKHQIYPLLLPLLAFAFLLMAGCGPNQAELANQIAASVSETVESIPSVTPLPTLTPYPPLPTATPYPTLTPFPQLPTSTPYPTLTPYATPDLTNLFCGYGFCIGHPRDAFLADVDAPDDWSSFEDGFLAGIEGDILMGVYWELSTEDRWDMEAEVRSLIDDETEEIQGEIVRETVGNSEIAYVLYNSLEQDASRPFRLAATWYCSGRGFTAFLFSKVDGIVLEHIRQSLSLFTCQQ